MFKASAQTLFDIRFKPNSLKFPSAFFLSYPKIRTYIFLYSGKEIMQTAKKKNR